MFYLSPSQAYEADGDQYVEAELDKDCVLDNTVHFDRPDKHQRQDALCRFTHSFHLHKVQYSSSVGLPTYRYP